jgi:hypothetical protein
MIKTVSSTEVCDRLNEILIETSRHHHSFIVEQEGRSLAVIIPYTDLPVWQELLEDLEDLRDAEETDCLWREHPEAFMSLEEFNQALDAAEVSGELPA